VIGVIGDHDPKNPTHLATDAALEDLGVPFEWIATDEVRARRWDEIEGLSGMFIAPSTPYRDTESALEAIQPRQVLGPGCTSARISS